MKNSHLIIIILSCVAVGFIIAFLLQSNPDNSKIIEQEIEIEKLKQQQKDSLIKLEALRDTISSLNDLLLIQQAERTEERSKAIPDQVTLINEQTILYKGRKFYGVETAKNSRRALVGSFGAQGMEEVELRRKMDKNRKAEVSVLEGINLAETKISAAKDIIIGELEKVKQNGKFLAWLVAALEFVIIVIVVI